MISNNFTSAARQLAVNLRGSLCHRKQTTKEVIKMVRRLAIASVIAATVCGGLASQAVEAPVAHASPTYLQPCSDQDKLAADPSTGTELVCTGRVWDHAAPVTAGVHTTGTPCQTPEVESTSEDGYLIFCTSGAWIHYHE
jgi:hypothetical protein